MTDYKVIKDFDQWVHPTCDQTVRFLNQTVDPGDIVVTHHLPSPKSTPPQFRLSSMNKYFVCDMEDLIEAAQPMMWIHGHSHFASDYWIGTTNVICNPHGYPHEGKTIRRAVIDTNAPLPKEIFG